jgi:hypothetical protein
MFRPTRPPRSELKVGGNNCCAFRAAAIRVFVFTCITLLKEVSVLCFGMPVVCHVCWKLSAHLMMAEYTEACSAVTNFKKEFNFKS